MNYVLRKLLDTLSTSITYWFEWFPIKTKHQSNYY